MTGVTLALALLGSIAALVLRPIYSLGVFMALVFCYSQRLTAPIGTVELSTGRIVIMAVLAGAVMRGLHKQFKFSWVDFFALATWGLQTLSLFANVPPRIFIERQGGVFFDTILVYFAVRLIVRDRHDLILLVKMLALIAAPLALMAFYQAVTGQNPMGFMERYYRTAGADFDYQRRMGMHRATISMGVHIVMGLFFALCFPTVLGLLKQKTWSPVVILILTGMMLMGIVASMSSSPLFAFVVSTAFLCYYPFRRTWPIAVTAFLLSIVFIEVFSNRHFYEVFTRFSFDSRTAYYRVGLIKECFGGGMTGHWWTGYGYVGIGPGNDNTNFHWKHKDMVNLYIGYLVRFGLVGVIPYIIFNILYYKRLITAIAIARNDSDRWMAWSIMAALLGVNVAMLTVSAMEAALTLLMILIGVTNNLPLMVTEENRSSALAGARGRGGGGRVPGRAPRPMPPGGTRPGMAPHGPHAPHPGMRPVPGHPPAGFRPQPGLRMQPQPTRPLGPAQWLEPGQRGQSGSQQPPPLRQPKLRPMRPNLEGESPNG